MGDHVQQESKLANPPTRQPNINKNASRGLSRRRFGTLMGLVPISLLTACGGGDGDGSVLPEEIKASLAADSAAKLQNPDSFSAFEWYKWKFPISKSLDTVGSSDGVGQFYVRLFTPRTIAGEKYPLVAGLGGLGNDANISSNTYAQTANVQWANDVFQAKYPAYVLTITIPFEACVNYEAEMAYMFQIGECIKAIAAQFGNVDMNRIYATGVSQGAGWSYEAAAAQPDLFAAIFINSGTVVHTTWGDQVDMSKLMDVNVFIAHGDRDQFIPPNEGYRVYNGLRNLGKKNLRLDITSGTHGLTGTEYRPNAPLTQVWPFQDWLLSQKKGVPYSGPTLNEVAPYSNFLWAGRFALPEISTWATDVPYATWVEPKENPTWEKIKSTLARATVGGTSSGKFVLGRFRIGDETQTSYDVAATSTAGLKKGEILCMTIQGYTGGFGDDFAAFQEQWSVDWAIMSGEVASIGITKDASPAPIVRPNTVSLANGGGPNLNNSLASTDVLDGKQVYLKIATSDAFTSARLTVYVRLTRKLGINKGAQEYASYWHKIDLPVS